MKLGDFLSTVVIALVASVPYQTQAQTPYMLETASTPVPAAAPRSVKIRSFTSSLGGPADSAPHAIYFDSARSTLAMCANGNPALCQSIRVQADDVLPFQAPDGKPKLLVIDTPFTFRSCVLGASGGVLGLQCESEGFQSLFGQFPSVTGFARLILNTKTLNEYQCSYSLNIGLHCSSAQQLQRRKGSVLFGYFTGDLKRVQALSLDEGKLCDVSGGCRSVQGTELLTNAANVTASGRAIKRADRAQIIGVSDTTQTACTAFFESETVVGFACEQAVASSTGPALAPYTVHGKNASTHEALVFTRHPFEMNSHLRAIPTDAENSAAAARGAQLRSLAVRAFQNAGGPMTAKRFKAALRGDEEQSRWTRLEPARLIKTLYSPDDLYGGLQFDYFPDYREFDDPDGHSLGSGWSDTFDFYFTDYNSEIWDFLTRAECIAACDSNLGGQNDFCDSWSTVVFDLGAVATVGATYVGFARGPRFAGTIFLAGLATSGSIAGLAASNCKVYYINERYQCRQRC